MATHFFGTIAPNPTFTPNINIAAASGTSRYIAFMTGTTRRWYLYANNNAESGGDAGSNFQIAAYTDAGNFIDNVLTIARVASGSISWATGRPMTIGGTVTDVTTYSDVVGGTNKAMFIDDTGKYGVLASSINYKENIRDNPDTSWIYSLRPVMFDYKNADWGTEQIGLIAEDVLNIAPKLVSFKKNPVPVESVNANGDTEKKIDWQNTNIPESVNYNSPYLIISMLKEIQTLKKRLDLLGG